MNATIQGMIARWRAAGIGAAAALVAGGFSVPAFGQSLEIALDTEGVLNFSTFTFDYETEGPIPGIEWFPQTGTTHDGVDAAEATGLPIGSFSRIDATVDGPATLTFWWKASTNNTLERLGFVSDDDFFTISNEVDWQLRTVQIGCGEQVISWFLDISDISNGPPGTARAWLDEVVFTPLPNVPAIQAGLDNYALEFYSEDWIEATHSGAVGALNGTVAQSGPVAEGQSSSMQFEVEGPFDISFDWGVESDPDAFNSSFSFIVNGETRDQLFGTETLQPSGDSFGPGTHCLSFSFYRDFPFVPDPENPPPPYTGGAEGFVDGMVITTIPPSAVLADAVDVAPQVWGKNWFRQTQVTRDGVDAACVSGLAIGDSEILYVELPDDPGLLSFWFKLSTENNAGFADFWIDGSFVGSATGERDWTKFEANLDEGRDRVLWIFYSRIQGGGGDIGANALYIDQVALAPGATNYQPDLTIKPPRGSYRGDNRYNASGAGQVAKFIAKRRRPLGKFKLRCQNDCPTDTDKMKFFGTRANRQFDILYVVKVGDQLFNISAEFPVGQFETDDLEFGEAESYEVWIAATRKARRRTQTARVRAVSCTDTRKIDLIKAKLKIARR